MENVLTKTWLDEWRRTFPSKRGLGRCFSITTIAKQKPLMLCVSSPNSHKHNGFFFFQQSFSITMCFIVAYDNNQIVRNAKRVGLAANSAERDVSETNNKQPHAARVLQRLNDIFPPELSCLTSAADQTLPLPFFFLNGKTEGMTLIQPQNCRSCLSLCRYFRTWLSPQNRRPWPSDGEIAIEGSGRLKACFMS